MVSNETIYNIWDIVILLILMINTYMLIKAKRQMRRIDKIFSKIKALIA